jgi:hypothetical protein
MTATPVYPDDMSTPSEVAQQLADAARVSLGRIRAMWPQIGIARQPGPPPLPVQRPVDARRAAAATQAWHDDRDAAFQAGVAGRVPSGPHPAPARLGPVAARAAIARTLLELAQRMWAATRDDGLRLLVRDPASRIDVATCAWCKGTGICDWPTVWARPVMPPAAPCSRCRGSGMVPAGRQCQACHTAGACDCDRADITFVLASAVVDDQLDTCDTETVSDAEVTLHNTAALAQLAAGDGPDQRRLTAECPVCGSREMYAEVSSPRARDWSVRCNGPDCHCTGWRCLCGIGTAKRAGRTHMWPARTWDGPDGLAKRLGVTLPNTEPYDDPDDILGDEHRAEILELTVRT